MSLLRRVVSGVAGAGVDIANDQLAMLRQQRLMEIQQNFRREERAEDRKYQSERDAREDSRFAQQLAMNQENMRADNKSREAGLAMQREGLNLQKDNSEYSRVADAYAGAMSGVAGISSRIAEIEKQQPKIGQDGQPLEDLTLFNNRKYKLLADLEEKLELETEKAKAQVGAINKQFPGYQKYFTLPQENTTPKLLRRPGSN